MSFQHFGHTVLHSPHISHSTKAQKEDKRLAKAASIARRLFKFNWKTQNAIFAYARVRRIGVWLEKSGEKSEEGSTTINRSKLHTRRCACAFNCNHRESRVEGALVKPRTRARGAAKLAQNLNHSQSRSQSQAMTKQS